MTDLIEEKTAADEVMSRPAGPQNMPVLASLRRKVSKCEGMSPLQVNLSAIENENECY
jgi:hypothetical protein